MGAYKHTINRVIVQSCVCLNPEENGVGVISSDAASLLAVVLSELFTDRLGPGDAIVEQIDRIMIRRRKIERFIESVKGLTELITEFDESLWAGLVDSMTVCSKNRIVFTLTCGMETEA